MIERGTAASSLVGPAGMEGTVNRLTRPAQRVRPDHLIPNCNGPSGDQRQVVSDKRCRFLPVVDNEVSDNFFVLVWWPGRYQRRPSRETSGRKKKRPRAAAEIGPSRKITLHRSCPLAHGHGGHPTTDGKEKMSGRERGHWRRCGYRSREAAGRQSRRIGLIRADLYINIVHKCIHMGAKRAR